MHTLTIQLKIPAWRSLAIWQKVGILSIIAALAFYGIKTLFSSKLSETNPPKLVETSVLKFGKIQQSIRLLGTIHPTHTSILMAKGSGTLDAVVNTGESVAKGTLIAKIDNPDLEKNLQLSKTAEALAKSQYERLSPLLKTGYVSAKEVEEKKQAWINAQKEVATTTIQLDNLRFYAPFNGKIGAYKKREGAQINTGDAVVTMYDPSSIVVDFDIPCANLTEVHEGQEVHVFNKKYALNHVQKMLDEETHMCPADVDIICKSCLLGSTVDVDLVIKEKQDTIVIPHVALFLRNSKPFVYVVEQGKIALVAVTTGIKQQDKIEVTSGLKPGQKLVVKGQERLYPELAVEIYQPKKPTDVTIKTT